MVSKLSALASLPTKRIGEYPLDSLLMLDANKAFGKSLSGAKITFFTGLIATFLVSKKEKIEMDKLLKIMLPPFYFSMAVGIWIGNFDPLFNLSSNLRNNPRMVLLVSIIFLGGLILELTILKEEKRKNLRWLVLIIVMFLYYII